MSSSKKIKIMIADDHTIVRKSFIALLNQFENFDVIGEAENGKDLLRQIKRNIPDIVITDLRMPEMDGFALLEYLQKEMKNVKVVILSMYDGNQLISKLILNGACGFLKKDCDVNELITTLEKVHTEGYYYSPAQGRKNVRWSFGVKDFNDELKNLNLSEREIEVLCLICAEKTNQQIADLLDIKIGTVDFHKKNIYKKTGISTGVGLLKFAIKTGLEVD